MFGVGTLKITLIFIAANHFLQEASGDLKANVSYSVDDGIRPYFYGYRREGIEEGVVDAAGTRKTKEITIADGRLHDISLDSHSFELVQCDTTLATAEFYEEDQRKIKETYYKEMAECAQKKLGAEHVFVFHHQVRNKERSNAGLNEIDTSIQGYAHGIHSDTHPESADGAFSYVSVNLTSRFLEGRYLYMNIWRNIDDEQPIVDDHLAVLDQRSLTKGVGSEDYIEADYYGLYQDYKFAIKQYGLNEKNSNNHRWYYFPNMTKPETIFFKQWDSDPKRASLCFHTAFKDSTAPLKSRPRQSIEIRLMAFFPDHRPNTCPNKWKTFLFRFFLMAMPYMQKYALAMKGVGVGVLAVVALLLKRCCSRGASAKSIKKE